MSPRVAFVCVEPKRIVGLITGHLTRRFGCHGELEWIRFGHSTGVVALRHIAFPFSAMVRGPRCATYLC
jgi:hypothetical protein